MNRKFFIFIVGVLGLNFSATPAFAEGDEEGVWSIVDENGVVTDAIICTQNVCGEGGEFDQMGGHPAGRLVFQQPGHAGFADNGYIDVEYNFDTGNHEISEPLIVDGRAVGRQTTVVPKGQGEGQNDPKVIYPDRIVPERKELEILEELPVSADIEIAKGFLDKDSNYVEIELETTERSLLLKYSGGVEAVENISKDVLGKENPEKLEEEKTILADFVETVVGFIKSIFNI